MIILITGASHTGKTLFAQKLLEKYKYPYLSIDHLKMGLIRSKNTNLTPCDDEKLTDYLWPIVREMIKTAIENNQNLIVEGCYIPFDWQKDFEIEYLNKIKYYCLVLSQNYIKNHFDDIKKHANAIENRLYDDCTMEEVLKDNVTYLEQAKKHNLNCILIEENYIFSSFYLITNITLFITTVVIMIIYSPILTIIGVVFSLVPLVIGLIVGAKLSVHEKKISDDNASFMHFIKDNLIGFSTIKVFKAEHKIKDLFTKNNQSLESVKAKKERTTVLMDFLQVITQYVSQFGVFFIGAYKAKL